MRNPFGSKSGASGASFLPEDYLEKKAETRENVIYLTLFSIVIFGVVAAFFVTNQQWSSVKKQQQAINARYTQAAKDIEQLKVLEDQKQQMLGKAELTTALIEKTPRSLLLAELVNRMPEKLTLLELELASKKMEAPREKSKDSVGKKAGQKSLASRTGAKKADVESVDSAPPKPPQLEITLTIVGVAVSHNQVAAYVSALQDCALLHAVELKFSENTIIDDRGLNKFRIESKLRLDADARQIEPMTTPKAGVFGGASVIQSGEEIIPAGKQKQEQPGAPKQPAATGKEGR